MKICVSCPQLSSSSMKLRSWGYVIYSQASLPAHNQHTSPKPQKPLSFTCRIQKSRNPKDSIPSNHQTILLTQPEWIQCKESQPPEFNLPKSSYSERKMSQSAHCVTPTWISKKIHQPSPVYYLLRGCHTFVIRFPNASLFAKMSESPSAYAHTFIHRYESMWGFRVKERQILRMRLVGPSDC